MKVSESVSLVGGVVRQHLGAVLGLGVGMAALMALARIELGQQPGAVYGPPSALSPKIIGLHVFGSVLGSSMLLALYGRIRGVPIPWSRLGPLAAVNLVAGGLALIGTLLYFVPGYFLLVVTFLVGPHVIERPLIEGVRSGLAAGWRHFWTLAGTVAVLVLILGLGSIVVVLGAAFLDQATSTVKLALTVGVEGLAMGVVAATEIALAAALTPAPASEVGRTAAVFD